MGETSRIETPQTKLPTIPVECTKGHRIYLVYFEALDNYGFGCAVCHTLGVTIVPSQMHEKILEVVLASGPKLKKLSGDLLLFTEQRAEKVSCPKGHQLGVMSVGHPGKPEHFGFFCDHCKLYSLSVEHRGRVVMIQERFTGGKLYAN